MKPLVFIDDHEGTAALRIREWLAEREDIELLAVEDSSHRDSGARRRCLNRADLAILCLPEDAAPEAVSWVENPNTRILDTSAAHRMAEGWVYGLPELSPERRGAIAASRRVANPGCYATPVALMLRPLVDAGLLPPEAPVVIHALAGYSAGGRQMVKRWEDAGTGLRHLPFEARYGIDDQHQHVPEMLKATGLKHEPQFLPALGPFRCGMRLEIPLHGVVVPMGVTGEAVWEILTRRYSDEPFVTVLPLLQRLDPDEFTLDPRRCNDGNRLEIRVLPHPDGHVLLVAILDNLGKGAAGATVQNLNLMLGFSETRGLPT